jgi:hypothetical protein
LIQGEEEILLLLRCNITLLSLFSGRVRFVMRRREQAMYSYNLFRSTKPDGPVCAVPEERSVPSFVVEPHWEFGGRIESQEAPLGFDRKAAVEGVRFNGFYLFASFQKDRPGQ